MLGKNSTQSTAQQNPPGEIVLTGALDEYCKEQLVGEPLSGELKINCGNVTRVNSAAIRIMILHFRELRANGTRIRFVDLSPPLVHAAALIAGIIYPGEVESVLALYRCMGCRKSSLERYEGKLLLDKDFTFLPRACGSCGKESLFDELPESYSWIMTG